MRKNCTLSWPAPTIRRKSARSKTTILPSRFTGNCLERPPFRRFNIFMIFTGISDEAGALIDTQIKATRELGWKYIEARNVEVPGFPKSNLHDIAEPAFAIAVEKLKDAGVGVYCFGSTIANWAKKIDQPFDLAEVERAIPRMKQLGTRFVRIMS